MSNYFTQVPVFDKVDKQLPTNSNATSTRKNSLFHFTNDMSVVIYSVCLNGLPVV